MTLKQFHKAYYGVDAPLWWCVVAALFGVSPYRVTLDALRGKWPYCYEIPPFWGRDMPVDGKRPDWLTGYTGMVAWKSRHVQNNKWPWAPVSGLMNWSDRGWSDIEAVRLESHSRIYEEA